MPSPFPGMDPYLEDPHLWPGFHSKFMNVLHESLNDRILPDYYADIEERVYITDEYDLGRKFIIPDIRIIPSGRRTGSVRSQPVLSTGGAAVCEPIEFADPLIDDEVHEPYVRIVERRSKRVITVIEVLSPTNKAPGSRGREQYLAKRADAMRSSTHWVEIDLLREGDAIVPRWEFPPCQNTVYISKHGPKGTRAKGWPIELVQRLPPIPIPLKHPDPDVTLDLQETFATTYDRGSYAFKLDYRRDPVPPLPAALAKWADKLLKRKKPRRTTR
jgi:hypothetical protein